ncbi:RRP15-like protein [Scleropages formosus]|uniref:RRP15-like protein n=1 Tax=Scleropages formosus TaxID=113540 RepID=UPI0010FA990B|nr:RRP15-like protein [Scleropages formosus]
MAGAVKRAHVSSDEHSEHSDTGEDSDHESKDESREHEEGGEDETNPNSGWAEAMAKILQKTTSHSKPCILQKNRELEKLKQKEREEQLERKKQLDKKRAWEMLCREKPDVVRDREKERNLQRIATRGVVQLFNAVRRQQKQMEEKMKEVGGSERKRAKLLSSVSKKDFISVLRGEGDGAVQKTHKKEAETEPETKPEWSILRDDFMMGASMKDWDKESDEEAQGEGTQEAAGNYSSDSD